MKLLLTICIFFIVNTGFSQFTSISQSITNTFQFAEINEANNVALIGGVYVAKSVDNGFTWSTLDLGGYQMPFLTYVYQEAVILNSTTYCLIGKDNVNSRANIIRTTDGGASWTSVFETPVGSNTFITDIVANGSVIIATTKGGVYRSADSGLTWNFIAMGNSFITKNVVQYNPVSDVWLAAEGTYIYYKSTDNGVTWTSTSYTVNAEPGSAMPGTITSIENIGSDFLLSKVNANGTGTTWNGGCYVMDPNLNVLDTIPFLTSITSSLPIVDVYYLGNGKLIASSSAQFFTIDSTTEQLYYYQHHLVESGGSFVETNDFELGETYGLTVGESGAVSRFELNAPDDLFLPADFTSDYSGAMCPSDSLTLNTVFNYSDSMQWYYNGSVVGNLSPQTFQLPYVFGNNELVLHNWYDGSMTADTTTIYFNPLQAPPSYTYNLNSDSTPCLGLSSYVGVLFNGGTVNSNMSVQTYLDDTPIQTYSPAPANNFNVSVPPISTIDTVYLIASNNQACGTTTDTISFVLYPGDDLSDNYTVLPFQDSICSGTNISIQLTNTHANNDYHLNYLGLPTNTPVLSGVPGDTISLNFNALSANPYDNSVTTRIVQLEIEDDNNCSYSTVLDTILVVHPMALFYTSSFANALNDTLDIANARPVPNRNWSVQPAGLNVFNTQDTVPLIYGNTAGAYDVTLVNTPLAGCTDERTERVWYADQLQGLNESICFETESATLTNLTHVKVDFNGNVYEIGVKDADNTSWSPPGYNLIKRDPDGNLLWQKTAVNAWGMNFKGAVIAGMDVDNQGDVFCVVWVQGETSYSCDLLSYSPWSNWNEQRMYLVKLNGLNGNVIWTKDLTPDLSVYNNPNSYTRYRVTDMLVTNNNIHFGVSSVNRLDVFTTDLDGNVIGSDYVFGGTNGFYNNFLIPGGSAGDGEESYLSPQLRELSNGDIACMIYQDSGPLQNSSGQDISSQLTPWDTVAGSAASILITKYNLSSGLHDWKRVAKIPSLNATYFGSADCFPLFDVDQEDNITLSFSWQEASSPLVVMDSVLSYRKGSCIVQIDSNYALNWLTTGNYAEFLSLDIVENTGEVVMAGKVQDNIALQSAGNVLMLGNYVHYPAEPGNYLLNWELDDYPNYVNDFFIVKLNTTGTPVNGNFYASEEVNFFKAQRAKIRVAATPCGDLYAGLLNGQAEQYVDTLLMVSANDTIELIGGKLIKFASNCTSDVCQTATINYDVITACATADSVYVPFSSSYGVNSVMYSAYDGSTLVGNFNAAVSGNGFYVDLTANSYDSIQINSPLQHSIELNLLEVVPPQISPVYFVACSNTLNIVFNETDYTSQYWWVNGNTANNYFSSSNLNLGVNQAEVQLSDYNGCDTTVSFTIEYNTDVISPQIASSYTLDCGDQLVIAFNETDYSSQSWTLNNSPATNNFSSANLNEGLNQVEVYLVDTNGCDTSLQFTINYCDVSAVSELTHAAIRVMPNPNKGDFTVQLSNVEIVGGLRLFNSIGIMIEEREVDPLTDEVKFDGNYPPGHYYIQVSTEYGQNQLPIIVQ